MIIDQSRGLELAINGSILVWGTCGDLRFKNTSYGLALLFSLSAACAVQVSK